MNESTENDSSMQKFEKLGQFYLGKEYDLDVGQVTDNLILYDSKDLCTHAVVVGMTGSGKTGLCIGLLEEAGMDRIPAIVIDPKGDIANLLLTFPNLSAEEFRPWIDEGHASREGISPDDYAAQEAQKWRTGLESWGMDPSRIQAFRDKVEMRIYTPGSNSGRPLAILKSFAAPGKAVLDDSDLLRDQISSATSGLLALLGIDADPIQSKEHILISNILSSAWKKGRDLDLGKLISQIQNPPFDRVGIMQIDDFFPKGDRNQLAMTLNNLLASPSFSSWMSGESLNVKKMLHNDDGKPCISILSIAHLSDKERMFFVTILLNEVISWMRAQPGTSSLRAMLYMDEVFGYFPPTKNPPSKQPMLTLLKQARAYGLGVVLATQNPVDLDYKGLSNTGTWFLGRLQTERDKMRVLEGLEGASSQVGASFDRQRMERVLAGLGSRKFLMNNVHDDGPVVFETRWVMSYLRGPLTRIQLKKVMIDNGFDPDAVSVAPAALARPAPAVVEPAPSEVDPRQLIPREIPQLFVESKERIAEGDRLIYRPSLFGSGRLHFVRVTYKIDSWVVKNCLAHLADSGSTTRRIKGIWEEAESLESNLETNQQLPEQGEFAEVSPIFQKAKNYKTWGRELKDFLYRKQSMTVWKCVELKQYSEPGETLGEFKVRLEQLVSEKRDEETEKLRKKYAKRFASLRDKTLRAQDRVARETAQYDQSKWDSRMSWGSTLLGALLGRRSRSTLASMRASNRSSKQKDDIYRAKENVKDLREKYKDLESEFEDALSALAEKISIENLEYDERRLTPRKSDIAIEQLAIYWLPWKIDSNGIATPIY